MLTYADVPRFGRSTRAARGPRARPLLTAGALLAILVLAVAVPSASAALNPVPDDTPQTNGRVSAILRLGNTIYLGGNFTSVDGVSRSGLAAVDATTGRLTAWAPRANARVLALAASPDGTRIYVGGGFTTINGTRRVQLAAVNAATGAVDPAWTPAADYSVYAIGVTGGRVYVGGAFTQVNGQSRTRLALVDGTTGALNPAWAPAANNTVRTLVPSADGSRVYAGGAFSSISGQTRRYLVALDPTTGATSWQPLVTPNGLVYALALNGSRVYTAEGGGGGATAAYDVRTGTRAFRHLGDGDVQAITVLDGKVYVGGHFVRLAGQTRDYFAAYDPTTGSLDPTWTPSGTGHAGPWVMTSDPLRGRVYAGGDFTSISGRPQQGFARFSQESATSPSLQGETDQPPTERHASRALLPNQALPGGPPGTGRR